MQARQTNRLKQGLNRLAYRAMLGPLWRRGTAGQDGPPLIVSGSPRSGSTWLLEVIERRFAARRNWEPVGGLEQHLGGNDRRFELRPYIASGETGHPLAEPLLDIVDGAAPYQLRRAWNTKAGAAENLSRISSARRTVVKFTEIQRSLPFIVGERPNKVVVLLRNPLAVTASALTFGGKRDFDAEPPAGPVPASRHLSDTLLRDFPELAPYAGRGMTRAEYIGLSTAIDMLVPLRDAACRERCLFVSYEALRQNPSRFAEIFAYLGDASGIGTGELDAILEPSARARAATSLGAQKLPWDGRLSTDEVSSIVDIMRNLGIDWYADEPGISAQNLSRIDLAQAVI